MDIMLGLAVIAIAILLLVSAFLSGSETALTAANRARLEKMGADGDSKVDRTLRLLERPDRLLGALLIGNNLVNILATSLATYTLVQAYGETGVAIATFGMTALIVVLAEITPKTYAISRPEQFATRVTPPVSWLVTLLGPVLPVARALTSAVLTAVRASPASDAPIFATDDEIRGAIHLGRRRGTFTKEDSDVLVAALDLREADVSDVMTNRADVEMINADDDFETQLNVCMRASHTRLPVWRGSRETIIGVVHAKDMFRAAYRRWQAPESPDAAKSDITEITKPPNFISEFRTLSEQFREFQKSRSQIALVADEYGVFLGVVTLEDIVEDVFGEIQDEHDPETGNITLVQDDVYRLEGLVTIRDFNRYSDSNLPDEHDVTVAGLIIRAMQMIPDEGSECEIHGFRFRVERRENNRLTGLQVTKLNRPAEEPPSADT